MKIPKTLIAVQVLTVPDTLSLESLVQDTGNNTINAIQEPGSEEKEHPSIQTTQDSAENTVEQVQEPSNTDEEVTQPPEDNEVDEGEELESSQTSQNEHYSTAIDDTDDTVQLGHPIHEPFLSCHIRIPTIKVVCISFPECFQEYLQEYQPPSQAMAHHRVEQMVNKLDIYLNQYPSQYINCLSCDSEFVTFISYAIDLSVDLTVFPTIWAVLPIILKTQDTNYTCVAVLHTYYNRCYSGK